MTKRNSMIFITVVLLILAAVSMSGCVSSQKAKAGDTVSVYYTLAFDDGTVYQKKVDGEPFTFALDQNSVIPGFEKAVIGMTVGKTKTVRIAPEDGYGEYDPDLIYPFDREEIETGVGEEIYIGMELSTIYGTVVVVDVTDDLVFIDFNHPLAGYYLNFEITLLEIK